MYCEDLSIPKSMLASFPPRSRPIHFMALPTHVLEIQSPMLFSASSTACRKLFLMLSIPARILWPIPLKVLTMPCGNPLMNSATISPMWETTIFTISGRFLIRVPTSFTPLTTLLMIWSTTCPTLESVSHLPMELTTSEMSIPILSVTLVIQYMA